MMLIPEIRPLLLGPTYTSKRVLRGILSEKNRDISKIVTVDDASQ
jgi:hypothetical protein